MTEPTEQVTSKWDERLTKEEWKLIEALRSLGEFEDINIKQDKGRVVYTVTSKVRYTLG